MTRTQRRLVAYLRLRSPRLIGAYELRDAVIPGRGVKNVHVQLHHARARGEKRFVSVMGVYGGYRWGPAA